jgi:hypothetical protein
MKESTWPEVPGLVERYEASVRRDETGYRGDEAKVYVAPTPRRLPSSSGDALIALTRRLQAGTGGPVEIAPDFRLAITSQIPNPIIQAGSR